ncbi:agamous-like MADS-box protein AGL80 [Brachypodium distachyon]|uniref:MADS-box domain-containing protein n=1 Tax=Brachypodium distachyon TaxID=15368 RepID=A0A0Q3MTE8_BRADI|nr:agamous-like MADS-box protein AGL80 [Brachypodium distachyon]KQK07614.2 hypothetical protein BRADI_2g36778v3 [Brachypodium distachyon]|eukprot:XP_010233355.1 agamous-like MADS-box protein AGL80 [Brachypodium distachyon]
MARGKVKLQYIENNARRKTTLKRRLKCLISKVNELSILCHVVALLVVYRNADVQQPEVVWPSMEQAVAVAEEYMAVNTEKLKKDLDGLGLTQELVAKERAKVQNLQQTIQTKQIIHNLFIRRQTLNAQGLTLTPEVDHELRSLNLQVTTDIQCQLQSTLRAVNDQLKEKRSGSTSAPPAAELEAPVAPDDVPAVAPMEMDPSHAADAPMAAGLGGFFIDEEDDFTFDEEDDFDIDGDGSDLLTPEQLRDILARIGI